MFSNVNKRSKNNEWLDVVVTIVCWHKTALVVFLQEDEDVPSVYSNIKVSGPFFETLCVFQCIKNIINAEMWA